MIDAADDEGEKGDNKSNNLQIFKMSQTSPVVYQYVWDIVNNQNYYLGEFDILN